VIQEAVDFRQTVGRIRKRFEEKKDWFFKPWNAEAVTDPKTGRKIAFEEAPVRTAVHAAGPLVLHPEDKWHGFENIARIGACSIRSR
jgi:arginine decarboxylase